MSPLGWILWAALLAAVIYALMGLWYLRRKVARREDLLGTILAKEDKFEYDPDFSISINDWGPDFEGTELGRWRWVVWEKVPTGDEAPVDLGNAETAFAAWFAVHSSILKAWTNEYYTPRLSVVWKKVGGDAASHT